MSFLVNDPATFAGEALAAFAAANPSYVTAVPGGVIRRRREPGKVVIVVGGGSGHFPAFAGWLGPGLGDAAVCGNVFASPSEQQVLSVSRAADQGAGILFIPINYAGDALHFGAACERLASEGLGARLVAVTDDIASGGPEARETRRGIAGSLVVVKAAGAAAARSASLEEVERIARTANDATRSFGVAFAGCTLPGADGPLFEVPAGRMAVGLGIHGEPGVSERELGSAADVADVLVDGLLGERPAVPGQAVAVVVNGLGATKHDELSLIFGRAKERLEAAGMRVVAPAVGEFVTSFDMAGVSLTVAYLDEELEELWRDPVDSLALSRGRIEAADDAPEELASAPAAGEQPIEPGSPESRAAAALVLAGLESAATAMIENEARLGEIDAAIGDGDHGAGMRTGTGAALEAARAAAQAGAGVATLLRMAGESWSAVAGGTSGALWGAGLAAAGRVLGDESAVDAAAVRTAVAAYGEAITARGGAQPGDKTMVDAIVPFVETLAAAVERGEPLRRAWELAAEVAQSAAEATASIASHRGRSRIYGEGAVGTPDAGAISFAMVVRAALSV